MPDTDNLQRDLCDETSDPRVKFIEDRLRHYIKHYRQKRNKNAISRRQSGCLSL
jgi:hypothetical protein